jgi:hypothetical protein
MTERPAVAALRFNGSASFRPEGSQGRPYGMASGLAVSGRLPLAPRRQPKSQFYDDRVLLRAITNGALATKKNFAAIRLGYRPATIVDSKLFRCKHGLAPRQGFASGGGKTHHPNPKRPPARLVASFAHTSFIQEPARDTPARHIKERNTDPACQAVTARTTIRYSNQGSFRKLGGDR